MEDGLVGTRNSLPEEATSVLDIHPAAEASKLETYNSILRTHASPSLRLTASSASASFCNLTASKSRR